MQGTELSALGAGEWNLPQIASLLRATLSGDAAIEAYEIDFTSNGGLVRRLVLSAKRLDYSADAEIHVLLSITDVTDARLIEKVKENLVRE